MASIYRGYEIVQGSDGTFAWKREDGSLAIGFKTEEAAMDAIDAHKRTLRAANK